MTTVYRLHLEYAGSNGESAQHGIRVQGHKDDATKLVLKSHHPEALDNLVIMTGGLDLGIESWFKGSTYYIGIVDKAKFLAAVTASLATIRTEAEVAALAPTVSDDVDLAAGPDAAEDDSDVD